MSNSFTFLIRAPGCPLAFSLRRKGTTHRAASPARTAVQPASRQPAKHWTAKPTTMLGLLLVGSVAFSSRATSLRVRAPQPRAALVTAIIAAAADEEIESRLWLVKVRAALGLGLDSFDHGRVRGEALG